MSGETELHDPAQTPKNRTQPAPPSALAPAEQILDASHEIDARPAGGPPPPSDADRGGRERYMHGVQQQFGNAYAQRMARAHAFSGGGTLAVSRAPRKNTNAQNMQSAADAEEKAVIAMPPPRVGEMTTLNDADQARQQISKVRTAQGNLFQAHAAYENEKAEAGFSNKGKEEANKKITQTKAFIDQDQEVIDQLQSISDISTGSATAVSRPGGDPNLDVTVGADMRLATFSSLFGNLQRDFARLQGVVSTFLAANPKVQEGTGNTGGARMGSALASGGRNQSMETVHTNVQNMERRDPVLMDKVREFKTKLDNYTGANHSQLIDNAVRNCGMKSNELRNLAADLSLPVQRQDTPEEAAAKGDIAKINADLAAAKKGLDTMIGVFKLAATVAGMPAIGVGALGAGSTLAGAEATVTKYAGMYGAGAGAVKTFTDVDISDSIKTELAKVMSDYTVKITSANGKLEASQYLKSNLTKKIDLDKINAAKTALAVAFDELHQAVAKAEKQKKEIRDAAAALTKYQAGRGGGGTDIAGMSQALGEVTIFIEQAKATKDQGVKQKELSEEMVKRREKLVGNYSQADPSQPGGRDLLGNTRIATAEKERAYIDCEKVGDAYLLKGNTLRFELWSDQVRNTPDAARHEVGTILAQIEEYLATAEGFRAPLQEAMFGG